MNRLAPSLSVLISSCDAYSDLWTPFLFCFSRYWPDCPYPVYLLSEEKVCSDKSVHSIPVGEMGLSWSAMLARALNRLESTHVLLMLEDFFLQESVDTRNIDAQFQRMIKEGVSMLRLLPRPGPDTTEYLWDSVAALSDSARYRVSTQAAIWEVDLLRNLLVDGESAWEFEINGTQRATALEGFAACAYHALPYYHHGVERGQWFPWVARRLDAEGAEIDPCRPRMSILATSRWGASKATGRLKRWAFTTLQRN